MSGTGDLLEHRTDGSDAYDTLYIGCEKFPQHVVFESGHHGKPKEISKRHSHHVITLNRPIPTSIMVTLAPHLTRWSKQTLT